MLARHRVNDRFELSRVSPGVGRVVPLSIVSRLSFVRLPTPILLTRPSSTTWVARPLNPESRVPIPEPLVSHPTRLSSTMPSPGSAQLTFASFSAHPSVS